MTETISLTGVYEPVESGWVQARIEELPGVITAAPSFDEAKEYLLDALKEYLLALATEVPPASSVEGSRKEPLVLSLTA